jgi:hypothetical protein
MEDATVRFIPGLFVLILLVAPAHVSAQRFAAHASGGPTLTDSGYSVAAGLGVGVTSRLTFDVDVERTHLSSQVIRDARGVTSGFRGGTLTLGTAQLRASLFDSRRIGPYGVVGFAAGVSRPNVTALFPTRVTNDVRAVFAGGGIHAPLTSRLSAFADVRMMVGAEDIEGIVAVVPLRAGVALRF